MNPRLSRDEMNYETNPKCGPEKFIRRQTCETAGRKEKANDRPNGGDRQTNGERANHPLAVAANCASAGLAEGIGGV